MNYLKKKMFLIRLSSLYLSYSLILNPVWSLAPKSKVAVIPSEYAGWDDSSVPVSIDFPKTTKDESSEWINLRLVGHLFLKVLKNKGDFTSDFQIQDLINEIEELKAYNRNIPDKESHIANWVYERLNHFYHIGVLKQNGSSSFKLGKSPRVVAQVCRDVEFIADDLKSAVKLPESALLHILTDYCYSSDLQADAPTQERYPVEQAVALLKSSEREKILKVIRSLRRSSTDVDPLYRHHLLNSLLLTFGNEGDRDNWVEINAPHLKGVRWEEVTPEFSFLSGGLGRVEHYHSNGISRLGKNNIDLTVCEPWYRYMKTPQGEWILSNYKDAPIPVEIDNESLDSIKNPPFKMEFMGAEYLLQTVRGINSNGIPTFGIRDVLEDGKQPRDYSMINKQYIYDREGAPPSLEFSGFITKAQWEALKIRERKIKKELESQGKDWKPPIQNVNDAQSALMPVFRLVDYYNALEKYKQTGAMEDLEEVKFLESFFFITTTHTYRNRGFFPHDYVSETLEKMGIPKKFHWLFQSSAAPESDSNGIVGGGMMDITRGGLRAANCRKAVAALHAKEVGLHDPGSDLTGITNGDDFSITTKYLRGFLHPEFQRRFLEIMKEIEGNREKLDEIIEELNNSEQRISVEQMDEIAERDPDAIARAKEMGRKILALYHGINPDLKIISYSGRWVDEKRCKRAFDEAGIEALLKEGANVVIYGNVQDNDDSRKLGERFQRFAQEVNGRGYAGKFIFVPKFTLDEQLQLLVATDVQIQDSDRATGASEYTESNVTRCGGLSMGSPYMEGVIQAHGIPINFEKDGWGNSLVPVDTKTSSYVEQLKKVIQMDRERLKHYQANSIRISRILDAINTSADYLRLAEKEYAKHMELLEKKYANNQMDDTIQSLPLPRDNFENSLHPAIQNFEIEDVFKEEGERTSEVYSLMGRSLTFEPGSNLTCTVKINLRGRSPHEVTLMVRAPDGNIHLLKPDLEKNAPQTLLGTGDEVIPLHFSLPTNLIGEYEFIVSDGHTLNRFPNKINFQLENSKTIQVITKNNPDGESIVKIETGSYFGGKPGENGRLLFGLKTINGKSFWSHSIGRGEVFFRSNGRMFDVKDYEISPGVYEIPFPYVGGIANGWALELRFFNPEYVEMEYVIREGESGNQRDHDARGANRIIQIFPDNNKPVKLGLKKSKPYSLAA